MEEFYKEPSFSLFIPGPNFGKAISQRTNDAEDLYDIFFSRDFYCMYWLAGPGCLHNATADKRDKHTESARRQCYQYCGHAFKRFPEAGCNCSVGCFSCCLVGNA